MALTSRTVDGFEVSKLAAPQIPMTLVKVAKKKSEQALLALAEVGHFSVKSLDTAIAHCNDLDLTNEAKWLEKHRTKAAAKGKGPGGGGRKAAAPIEIGSRGEVGVSWRPDSNAVPQPGIWVPLTAYAKAWDIKPPVKEAGMQRARSSQSLHVLFDDEQIVITLK